jgi:hypothetical protein
MSMRIMVAHPTPELRSKLRAAFNDGRSVRMFGQRWRVCFESHAHFGLSPTHAVLRGSASILPFARK